MDPGRSGLEKLKTRGMCNIVRTAFGERHRPAYKHKAWTGSPTDTRLGGTGSYISSVITPTPDSPCGNTQRTGEGVCVCVRMCVQTNGGTHQDNAHTTLLALIQKGISIKSIIEWAHKDHGGGRTVITDAE